MADIVEQLRQLRRPLVLGTNNLGWTTTDPEAFRLLDVFTEGARTADQFQETLSGLRTLPVEVVARLDAASETFA